VRSDEVSSERIYGRRNTNQQLAGCVFTTVMTVGYAIALSIEFAMTGFPSWGYEAIGFPLLTGTAAGAIVMAAPVTYSSRTCAKHITVGSDNGAPALILRQSPITFAMVPIGQASLVAIAIGLAISPHVTDPGDYVLGKAVLVIVTGGWMIGCFLFILMGRLRPAFIAIDHHGIRIRNTLSDTSIPWDALMAPTLIPDPLDVVIATYTDSGVIRTERVPRLWRVTEPRRLRAPAPFDFHLIDRQRFHIAPELIDAALEHYMAHPEHRAELLDPTTIARTVDALRAHAPGRWRRSPTEPVPVPTLTTV